MARRLSGAPVAKALTDKLVLQVCALKERGVIPALALVRIGARSEDLSYERSIAARAQKVGVAVQSIKLSASCAQSELLHTLERINHNPTVHGCLVFRPLPPSISEATVCAALGAAKDVDGITPQSLAGVFEGQAVGYPPCTAEAVMCLLRYYGYDLGGADVTVVGRSLVVGRPLALMLQASDATVTLCHSKTRDLSFHCKHADVLIAATGQRGLIGAQSVRSGQTVVDVGATWDAKHGHLVGDVAYDEVEPLVAAVTPVPGGVGSITTSVLVKHVVEAARRAAEDGRVAR
ncbi:MAG: bifunctional 5,10-methylene-tetrahydrofolate dehydrogenase/5,10-methylene-tetrahydrofolate cyclohydrolase [Atopobiaceae bacterium]|jgi:methylenetetrahydrofolate dehydrogenase (NADP+)/methenyltetrahydrofolate cyclohydrolase|nr:bifunctional 5,10-methylene-tetrahydrofolate dehydrogenase/5,10-methylene-tetrahydrofolate cyclohydrolase [Atopobiaceae bacterium]